MRVILVTGTRHATEKHKKRILRALKHVQVFKAYWDGYGKAAGPIRNHEMVSFVSSEAEKGARVVCLAFPAIELQSRGTKDCIKRANLAGIPVLREGLHCD